MEKDLAPMVESLAAKEIAAWSYIRWGFDGRYDLGVGSEEERGLWEWWQGAEFDFC